MPVSELLIGSLLILNTLVDIALAALIFVRAYRQSYARFFFGVLLCAAGWTLGDLFALYASSTNVQLIARYAFYVVPMGVPPCLWFFSFIFPEGGHVKRRTFLAGSSFAFISALIVWLNIDKVGKMHIDKPMNALIPSQPGFLLYGLYLSIFFTLTYIVLFRKMRHMTGIARTQVAYTLYGVLFGSFLALVSNVSLPAAGIPQYIWLGPIFTLIGISFIALAIIRYHLFDIRFFVVRATAYLTTLFGMTFLFITPFVFLVNHVLGSHLTAEQTVAVILVSVLFVYLLQYLRHIFDRATTKIFFRHYYDPQDILDHLSDILVRTTDLHELQEDTGKILEDALRPQSIRYILLQGSSQAEEGQAQKLLSLVSANEAELIDVDDGLSGNANAKKWLREHGYALGVKLRTKHEELGYILIGHKQSGEMFNDRDKRLLSVAADEIAISLQNVLRFEQIQRFNVTLQEEVDAATRKLQRQNKRLEELDNIKDDFISMASHQLRTPLTSVKGYLSMVLEGDAGKLNETQSQMLKQAFTSSQRMVFLITDLLNVSRLKTGKFVIDAQPTNLREVVQQELEQLKETAQVKDIQLTYDKPKSFPSLMLDEVKTRQVIMNFVDNAIYYTPQGGHIRVELVDKPSTIELHVIDDGIGVPRSEQHHLFTKFYRASNARKARPDGTGLGLFMAQKVITAQGGSVIFSSQENKGSIFGFVFSKSKLKVPATVQQDKSAQASTVNDKQHQRQAV